MDLIALKEIVKALLLPAGRPALAAAGLLDAAGWEAARAAAEPSRALVVILGAAAGRDGLVETRAERLLTRLLERADGGAGVACETGLPELVSRAYGPGMVHSEAELTRRQGDSEFEAAVRWLDAERPLAHADIGRRIDAALAPERTGTVVLDTRADDRRHSRLAFESASLSVLPAPHAFRASPAGLTRRQWSPAADGLQTSFVAFHEFFGLLASQLLGRRLAGPSAR